MTYDEIHKALMSAGGTVNGEGPIKSMEELWDAELQLENYRDKGIPDEQIKEYGLIEVGESIIKFVNHEPETSYILLGDLWYEIPTNIKIPDWFRWRNSWKPTHIGGKLNTIGELIDKILEVYPTTNGRPTTVNDIYGKIVSL